MCQQAASTHGRRPKLLVVDDLALSRAIITQQLRKLGYDALHAVNGLEALEVVAREGSSVAAILLDLQMPKLDGWQTAQALRGGQAQQPGGAGSGAHALSASGAAAAAAIPIVACTSCDLGELLPMGLSVEQHTLACGADACLNKPLNLAQLTATLAQLAVPTPLQPAP